jgi:hypothetical protein
LTRVKYQIEYHPFVLSHLAPVLAIHEQHGIRTESFGPLTPLIRHPTGGGPLAPVLRKIADRLTSEHDEVIEPATVLLLWTRAMGVVTISASKNPKRIEWLAEVANLPEDMLTDEEVNEITEVGKTIHFRHYVSFGYFIGDSDSRLIVGFQDGTHGNGFPRSWSPKSIMDGFFLVNVYTECFVKSQHAYCFACTPSRSCTSID